MEFQRIGSNLRLLWRGRELNNIGGRRGKMNEDLKFRRPLSPSMHRMGDGAYEIGNTFFPSSSSRVTERKSIFWTFDNGYA